MYPREYRPIELLLGSTAYDTSADIWAFGIILIELLTGSVPFSGSGEAQIIFQMYKMLGSPSSSDLMDMGVDRQVFPVPFRARRDFKLWGFCDQELGKIALKCLNFSPTKRPTAKKLLGDVLFRSIKD